MEHRWGRRVATHLPVRLTGAGSASGRLIDVSISGALIETQLRVRPSACITVETTTRDALPLKLPACVVRVGSGSIGVEWLEFATAAAVGLVAGLCEVPNANESDTVRPAFRGTGLAATRSASQPAIPNHSI